MSHLDQGPLSRTQRVPFEGDLEAALASHREFEADWKLLQRERDRLIREHPNSWVACAKGEFYWAADMFELFRVLNEHGLDPYDIPAEFLTYKKLQLSVWR